MMYWKNVNKTLTISSLLLVITLLIQFYFTSRFIPSFAKEGDAVISKVTLTYGKDKQDYRYREVEYQLVPFWLNRYELHVYINFDNGESVK
ncbi:hypothetical protein VAE122_3550002 [Vibrio aestuarianus]|nr:hypothetical protein VAE122_3550002 [Vibrio aestuarianus]